MGLETESRNQHRKEVKIMAKKAKQVVIKPIEGYGELSDDDVVHRATSAVTGLTGNSNFQNLPIDPGVVKVDVDGFSALIAEAMDGSKKIIAQKEKQREAIIKKLKILGRYVEVHADGDMAIFKSSGFFPASTTKAKPSPLPIPIIRGIDHGELPGEVVLQIESIPKAKHYEI